MTTSSQRKPSSSAAKKAEAALPAEDAPGDTASTEELHDGPPADDPFDTFLPLVQAAHRGGKAPQELIDAAAKEEIELLFECPSGPRVVLEAHESRVEGKEFAAADMLRTPEYFVVLPSYCGVWQYRTTVEISEAAIGYRKVHRGTMLQPLFANKAHEQSYPMRMLGLAHPGQREGYDADMDTMRWRRWILWVNGFPYRYPVKVEDLLVRRKAFRTWMGWDKAPRPTTAYLPEQFKPKNADLDGHDFISPQLLRMCEAAHKFWGQEGVITDNPHTYPSEEAIVDFLIDSDTRFSRSSAKEAARLIKPAFANKPGPSPK